MSTLFKVSLITTAILASSTAVAADISTKGGIGIKSDDGKYSFKFNGRIQADAVVFNSDDIDLHNGTEIRRARFAAKGNIEEWGYKLQYDFMSSESVKDAHITYNGFDNTQIIIGSQIEAFAMEPQTSSNDVTFIERSSIIEAFGLNRAMGVGVRQWSDNWSLNYGIYGADVNSKHDNKDDEEFGFNGRFNYAPVISKDELVSFGLSFSSKQLEDGASVKFRTRPESHQANERIVDTGSIAADSYTMVGLETAMKFGPVTILGEYIQADVDSVDMKDSSFDGYYVSASYLFDDMSRPYKTKQGKFKRVKPSKAGLWEVAARLSSLDLNDKAAGVMGGQVDSLTLGANYYINDNMRAMVNVVSSDGDEYAEYDATSLGARIQVTW
ncbi:OprO/OprP family phosphate-selective porin [Psychrobium sp. 1_MG-2023]|uniref:OprO/OprP family phosphate-selective porin n=1 Tax=Psychrobium sp. 1_MG-2023 TaxID=3062624 RepID=UPI000C33C6E0|nr:porin [Psychrobium sp. 1_MG-2023]MDP2561310.1 porin [Psychrobium sp. 1_MG-2023]PKF54125.1 porin [Alteromonadales bacterium alter-6D02]